MHSTPDVFPHESATATQAFGRPGFPAFFSLIGSLLFGLARLAISSPAPVLEDDLFADGAVWRIGLTIAARDLASLRTSPREYVRAGLREGTSPPREVGVRLKGSTGSFRPLDDKPGVTVDCERFTPGQSLHRLSKFHLNNSVEDPSYLNEKLGSELFLEAGVPAPRVTHAVVELNGRRLGLYVLKEGFTRSFLERHFSNADGNLYEAGAGGGYDIDEPLKLNSGQGPADRSDLRRLVDAVHEPDLFKRWRRLGDSLAVDRFLKFMAMEVLIGHRDGYSLGRNNFRVYHDPGSDRLVFLPDGMDQLLGRSDAPVRPRLAGVVARGILETPEGRQRYQQSVAILLTNCFVADRWIRRVRLLSERIGHQLARTEAKALSVETAGLCERIRQRAGEAARQLALPEPVALQFENGLAALTGWRPVDPPAGGKLEQRSASDGDPVLIIRAGPRTAASWRAQVRLEPGSYRFEASACAHEVISLGFGKNQGVFLGVTNRKVSGGERLTGTCDWTPLHVEFQVAEQEADVELVCALRARAGEARFQAGSLRLRRLKSQAK